MEVYRRTRLKTPIAIRNLITMFYFEFAKDYTFPGERHPFWELGYVDKGEVEVTADDKQVCLASGQIIFHKPDEFHSFIASRGTAPNIIVMTFDCHSRVMRRFEGLVMPLGDEERNLLSNIVKEAMRVFRYPFTYPLARREGAPEEAEQLIRLYLETFMLKLLCKMDKPDTNARLRTLSHEREGQNLTMMTIRYMESHIADTLTLDEISRSLHVTKTKLKDEFKRHTGQSVMKYFASLKIERSKSCIREKSDTFTEIAESFGFGGVHHFSRAFKKVTGMTPTEYARSVKARL